VVVVVEVVVVLDVVVVAFVVVVEEVVEGSVAAELVVCSGGALLQPQNRTIMINDNMNTPLFIL
jgi:hypothetical protein